MLLHALTQLVGAVEAEIQQALHGRLRDGGQPAAHQVLAQQHAEHGGLRRIVPGHLRQLDAGGIGSGVQQQPLISPQQQNDLIPCGLLYLVDPQV